MWVLNINGGTCGQHLLDLYFVIERIVPAYMFSGIMLSFTRIISTVCICLNTVVRTVFWYVLSLRLYCYWVSKTYERCSVLFINRKFSYLQLLYRYCFLILAWIWSLFYFSQINEFNMEFTGYRILINTIKLTLVYFFFLF